nr:hypothetical protein [Tanacetum cinerariifolium]
TFFLRTKDETSSILRNLITEIKAARTMLADAKLPVTFWAEAVNTACYVQNRVLVNKSQNKTSYELFNSRIHAIRFLRLFGCHVMILNTLDHLKKFDAKGDEGYFVGYLFSKAFRVFNKRTKKVEENLHVDFLENKLIEKGSNDTEEMVNVLSLMEAANILSSGGAAFPTAGVSTVSGSFSTISAIFTIASVVTPYTRRSRGITIGSLQPMTIPIISAKDKGKEKVAETEVPKKKKLQEQVDAQVAREMEKEFVKENQRSNEVIAKHLSEYEQAEADLSVGEKIELKSELVKYQDHRAKILKYQAQQSKPLSKKEQKKFYMYVLKSHVGWKTKHFRGMTLEQIKEKFIPVWIQLEDFVPMSSKEESERVKRPGIKLDQGSLKRVKISHTSRSKPSQEQQFKGFKGVSEEELNRMMQLVPLEEVYIEALQVKHPIIDWEIHSKGKREYWKIIRLGGHTGAYQFFVDILKKFDREDLHQLWTLVKETFNIKQATRDKEKELWVELKRLFEPDSKDQLWTYHQAFMHDPLDWKLYDTCGVHHVSTNNQEIFMIRKIYSKGLTSGEDNNDGDHSETFNTSPLVPPSTQQIPHTVLSIKLPILKKGEYDIWAMKMEHYLSHTDYPIWQVIQNGNGPVSVTTDTHGIIKVLPPKTTEEVMARERERKARTTLLMALPEDQIAKFYKMADAKEMSLPSSWSQVDLIIRTNPGLDTLSFDDLYNNLRVFKCYVKGTTASSSNIQNVAFVSTENTSSTNDVSTAYSVSSHFVSKLQKEGSSSYTNEVIHSFFKNQSSAHQLDYDDLEQINDDNMEEMDLKWQLDLIRPKWNASITIKWDILLETAELKGTKTTEEEMLEDIDWSGHVEEDAQNYDMMAYSFSNSCSDNKVKSCSKACKESYARLKKLYDDQRDKLGDATVEIIAYTLALKKSVFMNKANDLEHTPVNDRFADGMHAIPPLMTENYMTSGPDVERDYSKFTYGPKHTLADESDSKPSEYASCVSESSVETSTSMPELI